MNQVIAKELKNVRYTLGDPSASKGIYNQLKAAFPQGKEYQLFTEPVISGDKIIWTTEYEGNPVCITQISEEQQSLVKARLSAQITKLIEAAKNFEDQKLIAFLYKCIEIPALKDIFVIQNNGQENVVLTQWGFLNDTPGADKGILDKIINAKRVPMVFKVRFEDGTPAPNAEVSFEYEGKKEIQRSSSDATITLASVKEESYVKSYEIEQAQAINVKGHTCIEYGDYFIVVSEKADMLFKVTGSDGSIQPNQSYTFTWAGGQEELKSNEAGEITLPNIKINAEVSASHATAGISNFICEKGKAFYPLVIEIEVIEPEVPVQHSMKFKVVDKKNNPITEAEVTVQYNGKTEKLMTDSQGYCLLEDIEIGTQVKVTAKK